MYNHLGNEISYSKLSLLDRSVIEYYNRYVLKLPEPNKDSYRFGNAFDACITDPIGFKNNWTIKDTATTKLNMHITQIEYEAIIKMAESLHKFNNWGSQSNILNNYTLKEIFDTGDMQTELYWQDNNVACRGKMDIDLILFNYRLAFDIKTTAAESLEDCIKSIFNFKYYIQAAHYVNAMQTLSPHLIPKFYFVFVSKKTYECWVLHVTDELLEYGNNERIRLINKLLDLEKSGDYLKPQPCTDIWLPSWIKNKF
jgi:hypothetical protein